MLFQVAEPQRQEAKNPHELFIINLIAFHLLLAPAAIALDIGAWALLLPPLLSGAVIGYIATRARRQGDAWFVTAHWKLASRRTRLLLVGYGVTAAILLLAWLLSLGMTESMRDIMFTALTRIAVMPTIILVFVSFVLESSALMQAGRGEVPDALLARYPAPPEMVPAAPKSGQ